MNDWANLDYLEKGTPRQLAAFQCLHKLGILRELEEYRPILVSTICIGIDIESSDLDIICQIDEPIKFTRIIKTLYGELPNFKLFHVDDGNTSVVAEFEFETFIIEVFGQPVFVEKQAAYRHLSVMARLLSSGGDAMRESIRELKRQGIKSEPAFIKYLGLSGDPYKVLLDFEDLSDDQLARFVTSKVVENQLS